MQFSAVLNIFIVKTWLSSTFTKDLKRKYFFFSKNVHSYRVCSFAKELELFRDDNYVGSNENALTCNGFSTQDYQDRRGSPTQLVYKRQ